MAKLFASELATEVTTAALHLHGGIGYTAQTPVEMLLRDSHAFTIGEGTSEVMRLIIGRAEFAMAAGRAEAR
jgi:alkylation response protein AidB-like acyl-CoA dehydrogenase